MLAGATICVNGAFSNITNTIPTALKVFGQLYFTLGAPNSTAVALAVQLRDALLAGLDRVPEGHQVMFKLSLPSTNNFYSVFINDPRVLRVVALSGGYSRDDACDMLTANHGMIASFSRALSEGLSAQQSDADFTATLQATIDEIYTASIT